MAKYVQRNCTYTVVMGKPKKKKRPNFISKKGHKFMLKI